jgi:hypothetical protein
MLEKLLRARLPEQIVALVEKLEQDPDTSHLQRVEWLLKTDSSRFTRYERWVIKRALRKSQDVVRREETLNRVMSIVINEPVKEKGPDVSMYPNPGLQGAGLSLQQHGALHQANIARIQAAQLQAQHDARNYAQGYTDTRSLYNGKLL